MSKNETQPAKVLDLNPKLKAAHKPAWNQGDLSFDVPRPRIASKTESKVAASEVNPYSRDGIRLTKLGRRVLIGAGLTGLAMSMYLGYEAAKEDPLPQPVETGITVNIYPQDGEGENQLMLDVARPGVDSDQLRSLVESTEDEKGRLLQGPIPVDTGFLTTDQDVLLQYGVQPQDLLPKQ